MVKELLTPDYIFEASWEVCNKVGGIYTVLSTRANTLQTKFRDKVFFVGPDFWQGKENPLFIESDNLCAAWKKYAIEKDNLSVRVGRWNIPGEPIVILVDFQPFFAQKNEIYAEMWEHYQVDSLHAYGDYDEASMFAYATGKVVESFYRYNLTETDKVVFQAHEWMTGMAALYLQTAVPEIATIFTTHATSIGRSIAGNNKPLYDYLFAYNGDQMAQELNMESKHSIEKQTAHYVDCFTTVSEITNNECKELLDKYEHDTRISMIAGFNNEEITPDITSDYFFATTFSIWGWASWRRVTDQWDEFYTFLDDKENMRQLKNLIHTRRYRKDFIYMCQRHREHGKAYYETIFHASMLFNSGLSIVPTRNMINNLGATADSTHFAGSVHTMPRGYRRIFTMKRHEVEFPLKHPRHVIENTAYKDSVYRIMAWRHPWIKIARSFEELALNLRYGNFTIIWQTLQKRIRKWTKQDRHL